MEHKTAGKLRSVVVDDDPTPTQTLDQDLGEGVGPDDSPPGNYFPQNRGVPGDEFPGENTLLAPDADGEDDGSLDSGIQVDLDTLSEDGEDSEDGEGGGEIGTPIQALNSQPAKKKRGKGPGNKASSPSSRVPGKPRKQGRATDDGNVPAASKRSVGRPRIHAIPGSDDDGSRAVETFPKPAYFHFKDEVLENSGKPSSFFRYWRKAYEDLALRDRIIVYVYRTWPVLKEGRRQLDKMTVPIAMEDLQLRYGAGDYHLKMNDTGMRYKTVAICTAKGFRDEVNHPPVFELDALETNDPLNKSFIERLRSRGIRVPGDAGYVGPEDKEKQEKEDSMAQIEPVIRTVTDTMERTTDRMFDIVEQQQKEKAELEKKVRESTSPETNAANKSMEIMADAAMLSNQMLAKQLSNANNPLGGLKEVLGLLKELRPDPAPASAQASNGGNELIKDLVKQNLEREQKFHEQLFNMQSDRIKQLEESIQRMTNRESSPATSQEIYKPKTLIEQVQEMKEAKEAFREVLGLDEGGGGGGFTDKLPEILQGLALLGSIVVSGLHNAAVLKTGAGTPIQPPTPTDILTAEQQSAVREAGFSMPGDGQNPQHPHNPNTDGDAMNFNPFAQYHAFVETLRPSLLKAINDGISGAEYAETLVELGDNGLFGPNMSGRQTYDMLLEKGQETINALIKSYPPVWNVVRQTPKKWEKFITDFFNADEIYAQQQQQHGQGSDQGPAPGGPRSVIIE